MQALKSINITVYGDGNQTRGFQYIQDLAEAMIRTMNFKDDFYGSVNIVNPDELTKLELAKRLNLQILNQIEFVYLYLKMILCKGNLTFHLLKKELEMTVIFLKPINYKFESVVNKRTYY
jgi:nucleoside-diphosphate-sugar epimerase